MSNKNPSQQVIQDILLSTYVGRERHNEDKAILEKLAAASDGVLSNLINQNHAKQTINALLTLGHFAHKTVLPLSKENMQKYAATFDNVIGSNLQKVANMKGHDDKPTPRQGGPR